MQSVLISIRPKWCELIANVRKIVEVRKTKPKLAAPFKCYIYCTNNKEMLWVLREAERVFTPKKIASMFTAKNAGGAYKANGKVIGEFICDEIYDIGYSPYNHGGFISDTDNLYEKSCLDLEQMFNYLSQGYGYGWHISDLVIYDKPKELGEFKNRRNGTPMTKPPQSWCYVDDVA